MRKIFENESYELVEDSFFEFLMTNDEVAKGYGTNSNAIIKTKSRHSDELIENKHFLFIESDTNGGKQRKLFWTKRGVIRLGFLIKSERAKKFRDWAEDLVINKLSQTPEKPHQTVQVQNQTLVEELQNLKEYKDFSFEILDFVEQLRQKNSIDLYRFDKFMTAKFGESPLNKFKIDLENYYFIPTELGNFINASPVEMNKILEFKGFQTKQNGAWKLTEKGRSFAIEVQNGSFLQIKWKLKAISE
jgi:prophage antirepressor-like protein